jgi:hypothetical protein
MQDKRVQDSMAQDSKAQRQGAGQQDVAAGMQDNRVQADQGTRIRHVLGLMRDVWVEQ